MLDQPQKPLVLPDMQPGASYGIDRQCELAFGEGSKPCPFIQPPCGRLWCTGKSNGHLVCMTRHFPWADGTECGNDQVCEQGICASKQLQNARVRLTRAAEVATVIPFSFSKTIFCLCSSRWMAAGVNGASLAPARAPVAAVCNCLGESATTQFPQMGGNTAKAFGSNTAPAT